MTTRSVWRPVMEHYNMYYFDSISELYLTIRSINVFLDEDIQYVFVRYHLWHCLIVKCHFSSNIKFSLFRSPGKKWYFYFPPKVWISNPPKLKDFRSTQMKDHQSAKLEFFSLFKRNMYIRIDSNTTRRDKELTHQRKFIIFHFYLRLFTNY